MFRSQTNRNAKANSRGLHGIEQLEQKELFASLLGDTVAEPETPLPANQFYLRQDAHGGDQDGDVDMFSADNQGGFGHISPALATTIEKN